VRRRLGTLTLRGQIGAAGPLTTDRVELFTRAVPAGTFPVEVLVVQTENDARVALARVVFRDVPPGRFEVATCEGRVPVREDGAGFGYLVDSGTGCFADPKTDLD
jgi:hypothetical protein